MSHFRAALRLAAASAAIMLTFAAPASAQSEQPPKPGGTLEIGTVYVTLSALSFDNADWNWKHNHDTGAVYEQLFVADLSKSKRLASIRYYADAWIPSDAIEGELADAREWKRNPLRLEINLRKGVMFPAKTGVMAAREMVADDVVFAYNRLRQKSEARSPAISIPSSTRSRPRRHSTRSSLLPSRTTTPNGYYRFGWGLLPPPSSRKKSPTPAPATGEEPSTAPARSCLAISCRAIPTPTSRIRYLLGHREDQRRRAPNCRWSTRWSIAPSRMKRPNSPRYAPASSTSSRYIRVVGGRRA